MNCKSLTRCKLRIAICTTDELLTVFEACYEALDEGSSGACYECIKQLNSWHSNIKFLCFRLSIFVPVSYSTKRIVINANVFPSSCFWFAFFAPKYFLFKYTFQEIVVCSVYSFIHAFNEHFLLFHFQLLYLFKHVRNIINNWTAFLPRESN